jgi:tRNA-2-methylthio-N6-dimethylallyladenosine synthase
MNAAESRRLGAALETLGYQHTENYRQADVIVLNTCVVRQSAEDKAAGFLWSLKPIKENRPHMVIAIMGCLVGFKTNTGLKDIFPHVDVLMAPGQVEPLVEFLLKRDVTDMHPAELEQRYVLQDGSLVLPSSMRGRLVSAPVSAIDGCNHVCSYCVIPYRRGKERSRPMPDILDELDALAEQGVKEVVLLGQIVDRYGLDLGPDAARLPDLLAAANEVQGLERIRFLTSHPNYFDDRLIDAVVNLPKVCEHIEVPIQAGHDEILERMRRGYTVDDYRQLVNHVRERIPGASIATDVIVGFPGESREQFQATLDVLDELQMDVCHVAMYSPRPGTRSTRSMPDDVPGEEKKQRLQAVNDVQEKIAADINQGLLGQEVEILVEEKHRGKWKGRTRTNKLVFFEDESSPTETEGEGWKGKLATVTITWTGPWSMQATL